MTKRNESRDQQIWVDYEVLKEDFVGQMTSDRLFEKLARRHFPNEGRESALTKVKKIIENMRKSGRIYHPSIHQPMTKKEAAEYLGVSISTIDRLRARGVLKSQSSRDTLNYGRNKGKVYFRKEWLDEYLVTKNYKFRSISSR